MLKIAQGFGLAAVIGLGPSLLVHVLPAGDLILIVFPVWSVAAVVALAVAALLLLTSQFCRSLGAVLFVVACGASPSANLGDVIRAGVTPESEPARTAMLRDELLKRECAHSSSTRCRNDRDQR